jgi:hypothetical protein
VGAGSQPDLAALARDRQADVDGAVVPSAPADRGGLASASGRGGPGCDRCQRIPPKNASNVAPGTSPPAPAPAPAYRGAVVAEHVAPPALGSFSVVGDVDVLNFASARVGIAVGVVLAPNAVSADLVVGGVAGDAGTS